MQKQLSWHMLKKDIVTDGITRRIVGILAFLMLTIAGAFIYIPLPITPVPITLQTFFVLLCAAFLNRKDGFFAQGAYVGLGAMGLPVFSGAAGGLLKLFGPTGGYLVGFVACIYVVSSLLGNFKNKNQLSFAKILFSFLCGTATIYFCGGLWLAFITKFSFSQVITCGIMPFIAGDILKVIFASIIFHKSNSRMRNLFKA